MDKVRKQLLKVPAKDRKRILAVYEKVLANKLTGLDIRKMKGSQTIFRVRIGDYRVIYQQLSSTRNVIIAVMKRDDQTYRNF
jgi:mRNA interferase RelE/StbE